MRTNYLRMALRLFIFVFSLSTFAQTPPTITANVTTTSAICQGTGSISINTSTSAAPYNLVNSDLSALPAGATVGGENHTPTFTSGNPHYVMLTPASNDKRGFITFAETALKPVNFIATFGLYVGNGTGADGTSFNYGKVNTSNNTYGEAGMIDSGLAIGFNEYSNKIIIYYNKVQLTSYNVNGTLNGSGWKSVSIEITGSGQLTLSYAGSVYCTNYQLPAAYVTDSKTNWQYGFAARCGGSNNLHAINDVVIKDRTPWQYSADGTSYTTSNAITNLNSGTYNAYARIGDAAYNSHGYNSTASLGTQTITALSVTATLTPTNPTTCTGTGTIAISNVTHNAVSYDLVNVSLTNQQGGSATFGGLGTSNAPYWGAGDLVLTPPTSNTAGYIAFATTLAQPNAFSATYDVFVGGGNGGDGLSFNYGVLNTAGTAGAAESGMVNSGLAIGFSDYSNTITIYYNRTALQSYSATVNSGGYKSVAITVTQDGKITIVHGGITICSNYQLPAAYTTDNKSSWQYALAARCGASKNYHSIKNVVIIDNDIQFSVDDTPFTSATTYTGLAIGSHYISARQSNGAHCGAFTTVGTATITYTPDITATVASTSPTTCTTEVGTITISDVSHGLSSPYDLVNVSLTNNQLGGASVGGLGTTNTPYFGNGDLVLTPPTNSKAGYIAFATTIAQPNAFTANYDVFVGGGNGGDGLSFNYGVLNTAGTAGAAESGMVNSGLAIGFSEYSNTIKIYYNTTVLQSYTATLNTNSYKSVAITVTRDGKLTIVHGGITICSNYQLPAAYTTDSKSSWKYALAARTGGSTNYHSVKNVVIKDTSIQYTINGNTYTENPIFTNVASSTYNVRARISNGAYCSAISTLGSATIALPVTAVPTASAQTFYGSKTVNDLVATGTDLKWYTTLTSETVRGPGYAITTGTYYVSQTVNSCESARTAVAVTVNITAAPTASEQTFCVGATVANLVATGTDLKWYSVLTDGTALTTSTAIAAGTYYVTQTLNGSESVRTAVAVSVNTTTAPTASEQTFCSGATIADVVATGTGLKWYAALTGGTALTTSTALSTGTYYVSQTLNGCESVRTAVAITVNVTSVPTASAQTFSAGSTVADLVATGTALKWYDVATNGSALATSTALATGTYYVSQTLNDCESARTAVAVIVTQLIATWNGSLWVNPTFLNTTNPAIIDGNFTPTSNFQVGALTIRNNAIVNIGSGINITLNGKLTVEPGSTLTLDSNANLLQTTAEANSGSITIRRQTPSLKLLDYVMWSSPVSDQQLQSFSSATLSNRFYTYNPVTNLYNAIANPSTSLFAAGKGYLIRMPNNHPVTPTIWTGSFTGIPYNGTLSLPVSSGTYNAIGNPYPSTISADAFIDANGITEALYFWRKTNNSANPSYASYTKAGGIATAKSADPLGLVPNGVIQVGQGFIVKSTSNAISFTNDMRIAHNGNQFLRTKSTDKSRIWLNLTNASGFFSQAMVAYMDGATSGIDAAIDGRYFNDSKTALTSIITNEEFSIQGRSLPFDTSDVVPLGFKTETAGEFSLAIDHSDGLFAAGQKVFLKDNLTNTVHDLGADTYKFTSEIGVFNSRFAIVYQNTLGIDQANALSNQVLLYKQNDKIRIDTGAIIITGLQVYDLNGRLLFERKNINTNQYVFSIATAKNALLIKMTSTDGKIIVKKIIN